MRSSYPCLYIVTLLLACGPGNNTTDTTSDPTGDPGTTTQSPATSTTATTTTGEPTTAPTTTADPSVATTLPDTTDPTTGELTTAGTSSSTTTDPGTTTAASTGDDTGTTLAECEKDADCKLHDDCCTCAGIPGDLDPVVCDEECKQSKCSELGVDKAVCRLGVCETERLSCDQIKVACDALPPVCPEGQLPTTTPACWTGKCVPAEFCDVVPDCTFCPDNKLCVVNIAFGPSQATCEPIPAGCSDDPDCACAGDLVCLEPFGFCAEQDGPVIHCECINC